MTHDAYLAEHLRSPWMIILCAFNEPTDSTVMKNRLGLAITFAGGSPSPVHSLFSVLLGFLDAYILLVCARAPLTSRPDCRSLCAEEYCPDRIRMPPPQSV
jgi:hypothetical protein